ncbi:MAG: hypothetical protein ACE5FZ_01555 [Nitrospiria bacterium]
MDIFLLIEVQRKNWRVAFPEPTIPGKGGFCSLESKKTISNEDIIPNIDPTLKAGVVEMLIHPDVNQLYFRRLFLLYTG